VKHTKCMCSKIESCDQQLKYDISSQKYIADDRALKAFEKEKDWEGTLEDFLINTAGYYSESWETIFFPSDFNCGETVNVFDDACTSTEHWSNREDGQHDMSHFLCHFCVLDMKKNRDYIVEYRKVKWGWDEGDNWSETH
jgi:hypothetical protein